ncbi:MAG: SpoIIE family protein phosphatase [Cyanobacteriota bacterium]|nr:SpoIIE family protein phosphatase [Cyanobacteriota bacterium]
MKSHVPVWFGLLLGLTISGFATYLAGQWELKRVEQQFPQRANSLAVALQQTIDESLQVTQATGQLFEVVEDVSPTRFEKFVSAFLPRHPSIIELGWISDLDVETPSTNPITYAVPPISNPRERAIDPIHRRAIEKAANYGIAVATPPIWEDENHSFTLYYPIDASGRDNREGMVYGIYQLRQLLEESLGALNLESVNFYLYGMPVDQLDSSLLKQTDAARQKLLVFYDAEQRYLYRNGSEVAPIPEGIDRRTDGRYCPFGSDGSTCIRTLNIADREWSVLIIPKWDRKAIGWRMGTTFAIGILSTILATSYLHAATRQRLEAEALNRHLSAEVNIARKLQRMLLPTEVELQEIGGLEIASYMEPADEVGGDYFDVLVGRNSVKIGIGDVAGHGLESGVLAMMMQTAVRALLENDETNPQRFLDAINRTIYQNTQRMQCDKDATLCLLDYSHGNLQLSGQHEQVLIVRANGIERIDTIDLGFPIGLETNIAEFIDRKQIRLQVGDLVVLYTDGITEAENPQGRLYGLDRLCQTIELHACRSAREIVTRVIEDLRQYIGEQKVYDDITLLILKRQPDDCSCACADRPNSLIQKIS